MQPREQVCERSGRVSSEQEIDPGTPVTRPEGRRATHLARGPTARRRASCLQVRPVSAVRMVEKTRPTWVGMERDVAKPHPVEVPEALLCPSRTAGGIRVSMEPPSMRVKAEPYRTTGSCVPWLQKTGISCAYSLWSCREREKRELGLTMRKNCDLTHRVRGAVSAVALDAVREGEPAGQARDAAKPGRVRERRQERRRAACAVRLWRQVRLSKARQ